MQTTGAVGVGVLNVVTFTTGLDIITDFNSLEGDVLVSTAAVAAIETTAKAGSFYRGTLAGNVFTVNDTGADLLVGTGALNVNDLNMAANSIALVGGFANFNTATNYVNVPA